MNKQKRDVAWLSELQNRGSIAGLRTLLAGADGKPIATREQWMKKREALLGEWMKLIQPWKVKMPTSGFEVVSEDRDAGALRQRIRYENEPGIFLEAYLLRPLKPAKKMPGFVVLHSTSDATIRLVAGLDANQEEAFALRLARAGAASICPINMLWQGGVYEDGKYDFERKTREELARSPGSTGSAKMLYDAQRALEILLTLPEVDAGRLGCVGHSLGAKEVLYFAAFDERITVAVGHEGGLSMAGSNWHSPWYLGPQCRAAAFTHDHHELLALFAPKPFLWIAGEESDKDVDVRYFAAAAQVYELFGKPVRIGQINHRKGHVVPPDVSAKIEEWLLTYA